MDEPRSVSICVGIDVSKDRLDVHLRPSGKGLENLVERLAALDVSLIVLEATGGFETTVAAALGLRRSAARRRQSALDQGFRPGARKARPRPMRLTPKSSRYSPKRLGRKRGRSPRMKPECSVNSSPDDGKSSR